MLLDFSGKMTSCDGFYNKEKLKSVLFFFKYLAVILGKAVSVVYGLHSKVHWGSIVTVPNFIAIGPTVAEIWRFKFFKMASFRHLEV